MLEAETCSGLPLEIGFLSSTTTAAVDCLISLISHARPHLPLVIHTSTALHHHSLWCFATSPSFHCSRGPAVTLSGTHRLPYHSLSETTSIPDASTTVPFYHRLLLVSSTTTLPSTPPPGCRTPVLDTAFISSLPTTTSPSSRLSLGPNYRCLAHSQRSPTTTGRLDNY
jgi:hypothetical protein